MVELWLEWALFKETSLDIVAPVYSWPTGTYDTLMIKRMEIKKSRRLQIARRQLRELRQVEALSMAEGTQKAAKMVRVEGAGGPWNVAHINETQRNGFPGHKSVWQPGACKKPILIKISPTVNGSSADANADAAAEWWKGVCSCGRA